MDWSKLPDLAAVAALEGRRTPIVPVPLLSPSLSSLWLALVTDVDVRTGRSLSIR